jgi:hypothetical protein
MDEKRPNFAEDLTAIREDVTSEIGTILELARSSAAAVATAVPAADDVPAAAKPVRESKPRPKSPKPKVVREESLMNVTTRLTPTINDRLTAATLRQRLKKQQPDTRQAIIQAAVEDWLDRHGYDDLFETD